MSVQEPRGCPTDPSLRSSAIRRLPIISQDLKIIIQDLKNGIYILPLI